MKVNNVLENEGLELILGKESFLEYISNFHVEKNKLDILSSFLEDTSKRVTLLTATPFLKSNELVIKFLNSGSQKVIALKGIPGVYDEFFMDGHPKAVGVSEIHLKEAGIAIPSEGYIDSRCLDKDSVDKLKSKIRLLKHYVPDETLEGVMQLEKYKFQAIRDMKQQIENFTIYSNAHIFDLRIIDKKGTEKCIPTCGYSPVIPRGVRIVGIGPETLEKWGKVLKVTDLLITVGDISLYKDILRNYNGAEIIAINI